MRELSVQSASSTLNNNNRQALNAEVVQLISEIDRISGATSYNDTTLLRGFGNTVSQDNTVSTALASNTTGVANVSITGAEAGTYIFIDAVNTDSQITLGNGVITQTIDIGTALDTDAGTGGIVATSSSIVANFDKLGIQLTLTGSRNASSIGPASDCYRDGDLNALVLQVDSGTGGSFQIGPNNTAVDRFAVKIKDMSATGAVLNLSGSSVSTISSARSFIDTVDLAISQFTRAQILVQASTALLAQANAIPQNALTLLQ
jgi:flagellin